MILIFLFSSQSGEESSKTSGFILSLLPFLTIQKVLNSTYVSQPIFLYIFFWVLVLFKCFLLMTILKVKLFYSASFYAFYMLAVMNFINHFQVEDLHRCLTFSLILWELSYPVFYLAAFSIKNSSFSFQWGILSHIQAKIDIVLAIMLRFVW